MSGSNSGALFNATYYLQNNPDVLAAIAKGQFANALDHFNKFGQYENRSPNIIFNGAQYLLNNPDVTAAVGAKQLASAWAHFTSFGITELRASGVFSGAFNEAAYLAANPDVAAAVKAGSFINGYQHFLLFGQTENRSGTPTLATGQTFVLTTGIDTPTNLAASPGNDTFFGVVAATGSTLNAGDSIDGKGGFNTLSIIDSVSSTTNILSGVTLANIQAITLQNTVSNGTNFADLSASPGVLTITALNSPAFDTDIFTGVATGAQVIASGAATGPISALNFAEKTATDAVSVGVDGGVNGVTITAVGTATAATISSTGAANGKAGTTNAGTVGAPVFVTNADTFALASAGASIKTLAINAATNLYATLTTADYVTTGAALTLSGLASNVNLTNGAFKTVDASALSAGGVTMTTGTTLTSFIGGAGNNTLTVGSAPTSAATVKFGAGNDKLLGTVAAASSFSADGGAGNNTVSSGLLSGGNAANFKNFQTLSLQSAANGTTPVFDVSLLAGATGLSIDGPNTGGLIGSAVFSFADITGGNVLTIAGRTITATGGTALAANVATAFATGVTTGNAVVSGTLTGYTSAVNSSTSAIFTSYGAFTLTPTGTASATATAGATVAGFSSTPVYSGVTQAQGLTDTFVGNNIGNSNTLNFNGLSGTSNSYTNTFAGAAQSVVPTGPNVAEGILTLPGINNINIVSGGGANTWNSVVLGNDAVANTVTITGSQNLDLSAVQDANGVGLGSRLGNVPGATGVTLINASAFTGKLNLNLNFIFPTTTGQLVKGGIGNDTFTDGIGTVTFTGGGGADTFIIGSATVAVNSSGTNFTTITDAIVGDKITFAAPTGTNTDGGFNTTALNIGTAGTLAAALDAAVAGLGATATASKEGYFNFSGNTYVVQHFGAGTTLTTGDVFVKLNTIGLTGAIYTTTNNTLTIA